MPRLHVLVGQEHAYDELLAAAKDGNSIAWVVPKNAARGEPVLFYFRHLDAFVARGEIATAPDATMFGRRPTYQTDVIYVSKLRRRVPLRSAQETFPHWDWCLYPRSFTTTTVEFGTQLRAFVEEATSDKGRTR